MRVYRVFIDAFALSFLRQIFLTGESPLDRFFDDSFVITLGRNVFFGAMKIKTNFSKNLLKDSLIEDSLSSIRRDLSTNFLKYISFFFLCWIMIYVILELIFGAGFTKFKMLFYIFLVIILFVFTKIEVSTEKILKNSIILKWIKELFN